MIDTESKESTTRYIPLAANHLPSMVVTSKCANVILGAGSVNLLWVHKLLE